MANQTDKIIAVVDKLEADESINSDRYVPELIEAFKNTAPFIDWESVSTQYGPYSDFVRHVDNDLYVRLEKARFDVLSRERHREQEAARAQHAKEAASALEVSPDPELQSSASAVTEGDDPNEFVSISGDTKTWKTHIKECAGAGGFRWDGNYEVWNVRRSAWSTLISAHTKAEQSLKIGHLKGKLPK